MLSEMERILQDLDGLKEKLEKTKEENRKRTEQCETLRRAHAEQNERLEVSRLQIERQAKELSVKSEEVVQVRQLYEEGKKKLYETELSLKQLRGVNDRLRSESGEKVEKLEGENRSLVLALEDAKEKNEDLERRVRVCCEEIDGLKKLLRDSERKCLEAEEKARVGRELRQRDDFISRLEEKSVSVEGQLKWKKEQFQHLEEAHRRLQDQFQSEKKEWACEKSSLLDEVSTLQSKLDSQVRINENLESRLKMCNQALAHEESRRKLLEVQLSESKQLFENVLAECEEAKEKVERLSRKRDEEIASLRSSLGMKETLMKEMEYRVSHLEQDNKELLESLKELREAQITKRKVDPSLTKLRNKLKDLEQVHNACAVTLKDREAEWKSEMEKLMGDMKCYESDLKDHIEHITGLKMQLDQCHSAMEVSGEETSILFMVLKSEIVNAYSKLFSSEAQIEALNKEREVNIGQVSTKHLEMGHVASLKVSADLKEAREEIVALNEKLNTLKSLEEQSTILENELEKHKRILEESSGCQLRLKEQVSQMEVALDKLSDALEKSNSELATKINQASAAEMELQMWKSKADSLKICLEQSQEVYKQMEISFAKQVEVAEGLRKEKVSLECKSKEQEQKIDNLQQVITILEQKVARAETVTDPIKLEVSELRKKEEHYVQIIKDRDVKVEDLCAEMETIRQQFVQQQSAAIECALTEAERNFEREKKELYNVTSKKDERITYLEGLACSLEQNLVDILLSSLSEDFKYLVKIAALEETSVQIIKDRDVKVKDLCAEMETISQQFVQQQSAAVESAMIEAERNFEREKKELRNVTIKKDERITYLEGFACSLEQNMVDMLLSSLSEDFKCLVKIAALEETLKIHINTEAERKCSAIHTLEMENTELKSKMLLQEKTIFQSRQSAKELEALLEDRKSEIDLLASNFENEQIKLTELVKSLELEKQAAADNMKRLCSDRDTLLIYIQELSEQIGGVCAEDVKLEAMLGEILQKAQQDADVNADITSEAAPFKSCNPVQKEVNCVQKTNSVKGSLVRSPLSLINH